MADPPDYVSARRARDLLADHGIEPHKSLGQNFLVDPNTIRRIVALAGVGDGDQIIEIGPGLGSLTVGLVRTGARVKVIEVDDRLLPALRDVVGPDVEVVVGDARRIDWDEVASPGSWTVVANLPYSVAATLVLSVLGGSTSVERMVVMVQREVAERLAAGPGSRTYGIPSVKVGFWGSARIVGHVGREVFVPKPRVDSAILEITRSTTHRDDDPHAVFALVDRAFGQRRKMISTSLRGIVDDATFERCGIDPRARPETLDVDQWCALARDGR